MYSYLQKRHVSPKFKKTYIYILLTSWKCIRLPFLCKICSVNVVNYANKENQTKLNNVETKIFKSVSSDELPVAMTTWGLSFSSSWRATERNEFSNSMTIHCSATTSSCSTSTSSLYSTTYHPAQWHLDNKLSQVYVQDNLPDGRKNAGVEAEMFASLVRMSTWYEKRAERNAGRSEWVIGVR